MYGNLCYFNVDVGDVDCEKVLSDVSEVVDLLPGLLGHTRCQACYVTHHVGHTSTRILISLFSVRFCAYE